MEVRSPTWGSFTIMFEKIGAKLEFFVYYRYFITIAFVNGIEIINRAFIFLSFKVGNKC